MSFSTSSSNLNGSYDSYSLDSSVTIIGEDSESEEKYNNSEKNDDKKENCDNDNDNESDDKCDEEVSNEVKDKNKVDLFLPRCDDVMNDDDYDDDLSRLDFGMDEYEDGGNDDSEEEEDDDDDFAVRKSILKKHETLAKKHVADKNVNMCLYIITKFSYYNIVNIT